MDNPRDSVKGRGRGQKNVNSSQQHSSNCSQKEVDPMDNSRTMQEEKTNEVVEVLHGNTI